MAILGPTPCTVSKLHSTTQENRGKKEKRKDILGVKITINNRIIPTMLLQVLYKAPRYLLL